MQQQEYMSWARETAQPLRALTARPEERVGFRHPHGGSQPSIIPGPGALMPSSTLLGHQAHTQCTDIACKQNTHIHK